MSLSPETFQGLNSILEDYRNGIERCCIAVERCLDANRDNLRGFFEQCFSLLLKQTFGYEGSRWLNSIAKGGQDQGSNALVALFAPNGKLFQAIQAADADKLIQFEFPTNRLPTHTQQMMCLDTGRKAIETWPQYHKHIVMDSRGKHHVHLNVFEYYVFWMAFYVLRSSQVSGTYSPQAAPKGYSHLAPSLGTVRKALAGHRDRPHASRHPYLRLLRMYLEQFVPRSQPGSALSSRGYQSPTRQRPSDAALAGKGRLMLSVLLEFWLTDGDLPVPLPAQSNRDSPELLAAWKSTSSLRVRSFQAPSDDLVEALTVLVRSHLQSRASAVERAPSRLGSHASASAQAIARRLYRFLKRSFLMWPEQQPLAAIVDLWLACTIPWQEDNPDMRGWEAHVLSCFPFYTVLFPLFLDLIRTRVSTRGDAAMSDFVKVMRAWKASPVMVRLIRTVEGDFQKVTAQAGRRPEGVYAEVLPFLVSQRQDWEQYASAGHPLTPLEGKEASLFGSDEASAAAKARDLLNASTGAAKQELVAEAKSLAAAVLPLDSLSTVHAAPTLQQGSPLPPIHGLRRASWEDLHYKGDWMRRPLSSSEVPWLVRLLLWLSDAFNAYFELDPVPQDGQETNVLLSWLRKKHWKLNLRPLGEKQLLLWLPVCYLFLWLQLVILKSIIGAVFA